MKSSGFLWVLFLTALLLSQAESGRGKKPRKPYKPPRKSSQHSAGGSSGQKPRPNRKEAAEIPLVDLTGKRERRIFPKSNNALRHSMVSHVDLDARDPQVAGTSGASSSRRSRPSGEGASGKHFLSVYLVQITIAKYLPTLSRPSRSWL